MRLSSRVAAFVAATMFMLFGAVTAASAQVPGLMFPPYNPNGQYCYVARPVTGVDCGDLNVQLKNAVNGLRLQGRDVQFYTIFVREPDSGIPTVAGTPPAGVVADVIANTYKTKGVNAGFPANDFIMLVMTQRPDGSWLMAERWGSDVNPYYSFPEMKNILDNNVSTLRSGNYHDFVVQVARQTVSTIGTKVNATNGRPSQPSQPPVVQPSHPSQPSAPLPWGTIFMVIIGLGVAGGGIWFAISFFGGRSAARRQFEENSASTTPITSNIQTQVDTLVNAYDGMAMGKKTYTAGSASDTAYKAALLTSATYFAHADAVKAHLAKINAATAKGDYATANTLLNATIDITGEELAPELRTATSGKFKKESYSYKALVAMLAGEFDTANATFGKLSTSLNATMENKKAIEADLSSVDSSKTAVVAAGISFAPFQSEYDEISTGTKAFVKNVFGDPLGAKTESETLKTRVAALKAALTTVMELKKTQVAVATTVEEARSHVAGVRAQVIDWKYANGTPGATFALKAPGTNPDDALAAADTSVKALSAALEAGKVKEAAAAKDAATTKAGEAVSIADAAIAAKSTVDNKASALKATFGNEPGFGFIATAYAAQDFVTAAAAVATFEEIAKLHATKDKVQSALTEGAKFVTSKTEALFTTASAAVETIVSQTRVANANWVGIAKTAADTENAFDGVVNAIAADSKTFTSAKTAVADLRHDYDETFALTGDERVVQGPEGPRGQLSSVLSKLTSLESIVSGNTRQNWADIAAQAKSAAGTVATVSSTAKNQIAEIEKYEEELAAVQNRYGSIAGANYSVRIPRTRATYNANVRVTDAPAYATYNAHLTAAEQYLRLRRLDLYEAELRASQAQLDMINTWMWFSVWNSMYVSSDPWARQYAYDQGYRDGMSYDSYHDHIASQPGYSPDSGSSWTPTPVSEWTPSEPVNGSTSATCGSSSSGSSSSCGSSSSPASSCSSSSSSSSCSSSSSSSSCSSSSSSSCGSSSSSSSCGSSS